MKSLSRHSNILLQLFRQQKTQKQPGFLKELCSVVPPSRFRQAATMATQPKSTPARSPPCSPNSSSGPPKRQRLDAQAELNPVETSAKTSQDSNPLKNDPMETSKVPKANSKSKRQKKQKKKLSQSPAEQTLESNIQEIIGEEMFEKVLKAQNGWKESGWESFDEGTEIEVEISSLSSFGDGIAISPNRNWAVVVPFCVPNDLVRLKVYRHTDTHSLGDLISVIKPGEWRNNDLIRCKYFGKCSGCQYQMINYDKQLELKRVVIQNAFKYHSGIAPSLLPPVEPTLASPKQYEYRTKLTPHFELPRQLKNKKAPPIAPTDDYNSGKDGLAIGLDEKGRRRVLDIEECPLATPKVNEKLMEERLRVQLSIHTFKRGATLLLRESLIRNNLQSSEPIDNESRICVTDHKAIVREKVGDKYFEQNAGSFFQNNPSILESFMNYVSEMIPNTSGEKYLVDAYCGSGLFSISLAQHFTKTIGIELAADSLNYAKQNAKLNDVTNASFIVGEAQAIFKDLTFPADKTVVVIDPPRKGCQEEFMNQLLQYRSRFIIYVSCNVHSQVRDLNFIKDVYKIKRIRGIDFFPQTYHCESVVFLELMDP
ncbi:hypothetical protein O181_006893 [Austropuccinia psidii MF-1]|uniref:TRAM domain-containing protein n=1 Tax=Austropuccinia psidii MF-1 TaxID=1389203 RepID=A0A9Q3BL33_9BASI|nr:hypothetical protein [Austropuccinia psidii MF-1]